MSSHGEHQYTSPETALEPMARSRPVGGTEYSWCKALPGGTGISVLALLLSKSPDVSLLQNTLRNLQNLHPILLSKLHLDTTTTTNFSFITPASSHLQVEHLDLPTTLNILSNNNDSSIDPFHAIVEHEMNRNSWLSTHGTDVDVLFASVYTLIETRWVVVIRLHTSACDRAAAMALLRELLGMMGEGGVEKENEDEVEVSLGIENLMPGGKANKPFWKRGVDMLRYSLNSFRLANLGFVDVNSPRRSQVVRLKLNQEDTQKLFQGCKSRGIKLCGALAAAGLIAAHSSKHRLLDQQRKKKYAVVTLVNCRSILDPVLSTNHVGFYHSAILNTHDISGGEELWELAKRCYTTFANAKNNNKHFRDMDDLNLLMCKAIDNPGLTPSSSMRTACISVFEDVVNDECNPLHPELGVEDYIGCASVHGVGPSIAVFDTIRDGCLDCACVYPSPLHSREQMHKLIDDIKKIMVDACGNVVSGISD